MFILLIVKLRIWIFKYGPEVSEYYTRILHNTFYILTFYGNATLEPWQPMGGMGGGGGVLWYFHTYVGSGHFLGPKLWIWFFGGFSEKWIFFAGMKILWIFFWGHHYIGPYLGVISMHFRVFCLGQGTEWEIFLGLLKFQIFFGVLERPDIFWGWMVDAGPGPTYEEKTHSTPLAQHVLFKRTSDDIPLEHDYPLSNAITFPL